MGQARIPLHTIRSGGQTGVDLAALKAARDTGLNTAGWCPPGRHCAGSTLAREFQLRETPQECSDDAPDVPRSQRTEWNVRDADATLILRPPGSTQNDPGTDWTATCAGRYGKPVLTVNPAPEAAAPAICAWLTAGGFSVLNVAGPSEATEPGIEELSYSLLRRVFARAAKPV